MKHNKQIIDELDSKSHQAYYYRSVLNVKMDKKAQSIQDINHAILIRQSNYAPQMKSIRHFY